MNRISRHRCVADDICRVPLTRGLYALVDSADYHLVAQHRWFLWLSQKRGSLYYAYGSNGEAGRLKMHRFILGLSDGQVADHKDGDGLNNTRDNLRPCTHRQNMLNRRRRRRRTKSGYIGVYRQKRGASWFASIVVRGETRYLGSFFSPRNAAIAYDNAATETGGEFATLNFPEERLVVDLAEEHDLARRAGRWPHGVNYHRHSGLWRAYIQVRGKTVSLKYHKSQEAAARAYDRAAVEYFGKDARLNFYP